MNRKDRRNGDPAKGSEEEGSHPREGGVPQTNEETVCKHRG